MKQLQSGIATFQVLIEGNYIYADKTRSIYEMVTDSDRFFFLSRPRRFGKSLLLSTLKSLFSGPPDPDGPPQGLFQDLWIGRHSDYDFSQTFPVINLFMNFAALTPEGLLATLASRMNVIANEEKLNINFTPSFVDLSSLIELLSKKYNKKVVVLIDEYDAQVSEKIGNLPLALQFQDVLKGVYSSLKSSDEYLRFVLVTGVTRYSMTGLSAGLNHLNDLTFDNKYADICGFTVEEFDLHFGGRLPALLEVMKKKGRFLEEMTVPMLRDKFLHWYDGYSWDGQSRVLNPFSILNCFRKSYFEQFWIDTGPSVNFINNLITKNIGDPSIFLQDENKFYPLKTLNSAAVGGLSSAAGLFQTGYLTVNETQPGPGGTADYYSLKIPNWEVKSDNFKIFSTSLLSVLGQTQENAREDFEKALLAKDSQRMTEIIEAVFIGLAARHHRNEESFYHSVLYG
ncbi:MAG: AAA family ATPase, partial [Deltaproteobacteria bacterium]|nr:AAA family ATPase [Deltaproteobacteria bacterium]